MNENCVKGREVNPGHFSSSIAGEDQKPSSPRTPLRYSSENLRQWGEGRNVTLFFDLANPTTRSVAVFVTRISVGWSAMVLGREYQIQPVVYRAFLRKLPDVLSVINGQLINYSIRKSLRTSQPAPLIFFCYRDAWVFHVLLLFRKLSFEAFEDMVDILLLSNWKPGLRTLPSIQVAKCPERLGVAITNEGAVSVPKSLRTRPHRERSFSLHESTITLEI